MMLRGGGGGDVLGNPNFVVLPKGGG